MIDEEESATKFIERMTNKCTYLIGEDVLPKESLLYAKFNVLNELNNLRIDGELIAPELKQDIYNNVFKKYQRVTGKKVKDYLRINGVISKEQELSGFDQNFKSSLKAYHDFKQIVGTGVLSESEQEDIVSTNYVEMDGNILRYSPDGVSLVSDKMSTLWSETYQMQNPVADVNGTRAVIADKDGTTLEIYDKSGKTGSVTTSYSIVKAKVSKSGLVAAILDGGDDTWIDFYGTDGSLIAENQTKIDDPGYPLDIAVSEDGVIMMVTYQFVDGSDTTSYVAFYNFGDVGQNEDDRIVSGYKYEGVVVPQIQYLDNNRSVALLSLIHI